MTGRRDDRGFGGFDFFFGGGRGGFAPWGPVALAAGVRAECTAAAAAAVPTTALAGGPELMGRRGLGAVALLAGLAAVFCGSGGAGFRAGRDAVRHPARRSRNSSRGRSCFPTSRARTWSIRRSGSSRFEAWAKATPAPAAIPEPLSRLRRAERRRSSSTAPRRRYRERLHMYVAEARFVISRPPASLKLAQLATLPFAERIDPAIKHRLATARRPGPPAGSQGHP